MMKLEEEETSSENNKDSSSKVEVSNDEDRNDSHRKIRYETSIDDNKGIEDYKEKYIKNYTTSLEIEDKNNQQNTPIIPRRLRKTFISSIFLLICGIILISIGFFLSIYENSFTKGITFWVLGGIVSIPGTYFTYKFYTIFKAKDIYERNYIIDQIPEL